MSKPDINIGAIMVLSGGDASRKRLARLKLNLLDADINAWSCLVKSPEHLMLTNERLQLVSSLAESQAGKVAETTRKK